MDNSKTINPLQTANPQTEAFQYSSVPANYGITSIEITDNSRTKIGYCISVESVDHKYIDLELDRVSSMSYSYHVPIILCTIFFNVFQNTIALFFLQTQLNFSNELTYFLVGLCAIATAMQALLARAFKIIETPMHLTLAQEAFLSAIRKTLEASKENLHGNRIELLSTLAGAKHHTGVIYVGIKDEKIYYEVLSVNHQTVIRNYINTQQLGHELPTDEAQLLLFKKEIFSVVLKEQDIQNDFVVLISPQEYSEMYKPFFYSFTSQNKTTFDYALQAISQHYHTHIHILSVEKDNYDNIDFTKLPIQKKYNVLAYSYDPNVPSSINDIEQDNSSIANNSETYTPIIYSSPISLKRYVSSHTYRDKTSSCALTISTLCSLPSVIFLVALPFMGATLQGISSLNDVLDQLFGLKDIQGYWRLGAILPGIVIGASKATMTYVTKVPPSKQRTHQLYLRLCKKSSKHIIQDRKFLDDLCKIFYFDCSLSLSKRLLIIWYYVVPSLMKFFGYFAAIGTICFYAGLGLFFSNSGMYELAAFSTNPAGQTPTHESTDYSNIPITIISFLMCIAMAVLNGFFNQGWDTVRLFSKYAKEAQKHLHDSIESTTVTSMCHLFEMPRIIKDIYTKNTWGQNTVLCLTLIDSFAASTTAYYGSTKIMSAITTLYPPLNSHNLCTIFNILIAISIYISQTCFSFELYERDTKIGGNLWGKLFAVHLPEFLKSECIKKTFNLDKVRYPHTQGALGYEHQVFKRLSHTFYASTLRSPLLTTNESDATLNSASSPIINSSD